MSEMETRTPAPLLTTKFYVPPFRPEMVSRPRLVGQISAGLHRKLTIISAPAGFGKTTMLSEWIHQCERPVAWLSLDAADNDLARFLTYLVEALRTVASLREHVGGMTDGMVHGLQSLGGSQAEALLTRLINDIVAVRETFALVLDDYHLITAPSIHEAVTFLLDHLPPEMHLILAGRSDPPLPFAGLRGSGQLAELRQSDLRFTAEEAAAFLNEAIGLQLSAADVEALSSRTEGWIAGLQMAAISMQGRDDLTQFVRAFTGSNVYVLDYLMEEVLERQPDSVQAFLLKTSILDRLTGPLCDAVTAGNGEGTSLPPSAESDARLTGQAMLEMLERANLFIMRLDDERRWYRYHRLFADLLRQRLPQVYPGLPATLHGRACEWHEKNGLTPAAIDHALAARDFERAAELVHVSAGVVFARGEFVTLEGWMGALPDDVLRGRPLLCAYYALVLLLVGGTLDRVKECIESASEEDRSGAFEGELMAVRAILATLEGDIPASLELSRRALELLPEEHTFLSGFVERNLGTIYMLTGDLEAAQRVFKESAVLGEKAGDFTSVVVAQEKLGTGRRLQGRLREAKALYEQALESATDERGRRHPVVTKAVLGLADIMREWNDLIAAEELIEEGLELAAAWSRFLVISCHMVLSRVREAQGDLRSASDLLDQCQQLAAEWDLSEMDDVMVGAYQARVWLAQGRFDTVADWAEERDLNSARAAVELAKSQEDISLMYMRQVEYAALARMYVVTGEAERALEVLGPLVRANEQRGWGSLLTESLALQALAFRSKGDVDQALRVLEHALSIGEPEGYIRSFVDEGEAMAELLRAAALRGTAPEYVNKLLAAFEVAEHGPLEEIATASDAQSLMEPLSTRELEVLRLLNTSLSSTEMADELVVSVNTVRTHIRSIYSKLGVHSRYEAVARARELDLI
jgi:LuxR family maltose regulon positive regulatory protein